MRVILKLTVVLALVAFGWVGCSDDDGGGSDAICGNGIIEEGEVCDLLDLGGMTCADVGYVGGGILACDDACVYDVSRCSSCGDALLQEGEDCDCGSDATALPEGCNDVNGGMDANCSTVCTIIPMCGNAELEDGEECDCGTDPATVTGGCGWINGDPRGMCDEFCQFQPVCGPGDSPFDDCELGQNYCCPDEHGAFMDCFSGNTNYCLRECEDSQECYWSNNCGEVREGACWPGICGPGWPVTQVNVECTVAGVAGFCWPMFTRDEPEEDPYAYCVEAGNLAHGDACDDDASMSQVDRSEFYCDFGLCLEGFCAQFCVGDQSYDAALYGAGPGSETYPCPSGSNCYSESVIDPVTGVRTADLAYCREESDIRTCAVIGPGQLLTNPSQTCADVETNGYCDFSHFSNDRDTEGTRIGRCREGDPVLHFVWETCNPASTTRDCPSGTICIEEDHFGAATGTTRCVPYCDTEHHDGATATCADLDEDVTVDPVHTIDATAVCHSLSEITNPLDIHPTRVGLCTIP